MSKIDLSEIIDYFVSMNIVEGYNLLEVKFPHTNINWEVFDNDDKTILVDEKENTNTYIVFSNDKDKSFDELVKHVTDIVNVNLEKQEKYDMYQEKVKELGELFDELPLKTLKTLRINYRKPRVKKTEVKVEKVIEKEENKDNNDLTNEIEDIKYD